MHPILLRHLFRNAVAYMTGLVLLIAALIGGTAFYMSSADRQVREVRKQIEQERKDLVSEPLPVRVLFPVLKSLGRPAWMWLCPFDWTTRDVSHPACLILSLPPPRGWRAANSAGVFFPNDPCGRTVLYS